MDFREDLARIACDLQVYRLARHRAGTRELAWDALQQTYWAVARVRDPESIRDLRAFFCRSLIHEINRQRAPYLLVPVEGIETAVERHDGGTPSGGSLPASVENEVSFRILAERMLQQLDRDRLMASVPPRSGDPRRYQIAIVRAARTILRLLLQGHVTSADWNAVLMAESPQWCGQPGLAPDAIHQRLSRARSDVRSLLQMLLSRDELAY